jgi:hypothetical protein
MAKDAAEVLEEALALPVEERAALADSLLESIDSDIDEDAEVAWRKEVGKRVADFGVRRGSERRLAGDRNAHSPAP